jgi:ribosomal protein L37AE/L43A
VNSASACAQLSHKYKCNNCEKPFNDRAGLWRHKKKCSVINKNATYTDLNKNELIIMLIQQNKEFKELLIEQNEQNKQMNTQMNKQMIELAKNSNCITNNNNINTTNNNQSFNMNIFLNEQCKDALNIGEFVNTLPLTLEDLENTGKVGYVKGITDIVVRGLKEMDVHKRPIHCSDLKREVIYVKDNDVWHKDEDNVKVKKAIQNIGTRNYRQVKEWIEKYPEAKDISTKKHEQYVQIRLKCTGGSDTAEDDKMQNKILSNIAKLVHINK